MLTKFHRILYTNIHFMHYFIIILDTLYFSCVHFGQMILSKFGSTFCGCSDFGDYFQLNPNCTNYQTILWGAKTIKFFMFHPVKIVHTLYNLILFCKNKKPWILSFPTIYSLWVIKYVNLSFVPFNQNWCISQYY